MPPLSKPPEASQPLPSTHPKPALSDVKQTTNLPNRRYLFGIAMCLWLPYMFFFDDSNFPPDAIWRTDQDPCCWKLLACDIDKDVIFKNTTSYNFPRGKVTIPTQKEVGKLKTRNTSRFHHSAKPLGEGVGPTSGSAFERGRFFRKKVLRSCSRFRRLGACSSRTSCAASGQARFHRPVKHAVKQCFAVFFWHAVNTSSYMLQSFSNVPRTHTHTGNCSPANKSARRVFGVGKREYTGKEG